MGASPTVVRDLEAQVSPSHVLTRPADLAAYSYDGYGAAGLRAEPDAVVFPATSQEVADVVRVCAHHGIPVVPRGAGTGYAGGAVADGGVVLNLTRMHRVIGTEPEAMRIQVEAGVVTATVQRHAAALGLLYAPDPGASTTSTIGGNVACNASGSRAVKYGATGDFLVGATLVLADGEIVRVGEGGDGGDLMLRLLPGSEGTLAIVTEALFRLLPAPAARSTLSATFGDVAGAAEASVRIAAAGVLPSALEILDGPALDAVSSLPGVDPAPPGTGALVIVEVDGDAVDVQHQSEAVRAALRAAGAQTIEVASDANAAGRLWRARKSISAAVATIMIGKVNEDVCVPRDQVAAAVAAARHAGEARHVPVVTFGHLGDGVVHATFLIDPRRPDDRRRGEEAAHELFDAVMRLGGSITGEHGIGVTKVGFAERQLGAGGLELHRRIKAALDPHGLLNPGKKLPTAPAPPPAPAAPATSTAHH